MSSPNNQLLNGNPELEHPIEGFTPQTAHTPQPLNLIFENFNATTSKKQYDIHDISSILYNLGSF
jgi:hypothetical protein